MKSFLIFNIQYIIENFAMPKIELKHQGQTLTILFPSSQTTKQNIQKLIQTNWGLRFEDVQMTYCDSDGDQITVDIQEDFQVAKQTMIDGDNDTLIFNVKINNGVVPKLNEKQNVIELIVEHEPSKIIYVQSEAHYQNVQPIASPLLLVNQQDQKYVKIENDQVNIYIKEEEGITKAQQVQVKAELTQDQKKKAIQKEAKKKAEAEAKALAKQIAKQEAQRIKQQQKEAAKKQAQRKKQEKQQAKKQVQRKKQEKEAAQKEASRLKQQKISEKKKKDGKKEQPISKQKSQKGEKKVKQEKLMEQSQLSLNRIKQLIRNQVLNMIPELKQKILEKEQKIVQIQQKAKELGEKIEKGQQETCEGCNDQLVIPFYFNVESRQYFCNKCETTIPEQINLIKIRNSKHFSQTLFLYGGEVKKTNIDNTDLENFEKYIEQSRLAALANVKQEFKKKLLENRKKVAQKKQQDLKKNKKKKEEEQ